VEDIKEGLSKEFVGRPGLDPGAMGLKGGVRLAARTL
jgi:hypothetical protein